MTIALLFLCYSVIAWYHPRVALGLLLALLPTYLLRFSLGGIPMTVLEGFILVLAAAVLVWRRGGAASPPAGVRDGSTGVPASVNAGGDAAPPLRQAHAERAPSPFADRMVVLAIAWVIAGTLAALGSDAGVKAWGLWKAYIVEPVLLYFVIRAIAAGMSNDQGDLCKSRHCESAKWCSCTIPSEFCRARDPTPAMNCVGSFGRGLPQDDVGTSSHTVQNMERREIATSRSGFGGLARGLAATSPHPPRPAQTQAVVFACGLGSRNDGMVPFPSLRNVILPLTIGAAGVAVIAVWQYFSGYGIPFPWQDVAMRRVTSVFGYPNAVGLYLAPIIPLALGLLAISWGPSLASAGGDDAPPLRTREHQRVLPTIVALAFAAAVFLIAIVAVFFTRGAGAMVAVVTALAALPLLALTRRWMARHHRGIAVAIVTAWVVACLVITAVLPYQGERRWGPPIIQKFTFQQWSGSVRLSQYREMWRLLRDHPIRGAGLSGYPQAIQQYKEKQDVETFQYPHNLLLAVWSEMGLLGLLIFLAITITFFARAFVQRRPATVIAAMLAVLTFGLVDIPIFKNDLAVLWWTLLALGTVRFPRGTLGA